MQVLFHYKGKQSQQVQSQQVHELHFHSDTVHILKELSAWQLLTSKQVIVMFSNVKKQVKNHRAKHINVIIYGLVVHKKYSTFYTIPHEKVNNNILFYFLIYVFIIKS